MHFRSALHFSHFIFYFISCSFIFILILDKIWEIKRRDWTGQGGICVVGMENKTKRETQKRMNVEWNKGEEQSA